MIRLVSFTSALYLAYVASFRDHLSSPCDPSPTSWEVMVQERTAEQPKSNWRPLPLL